MYLSVLSVHVYKPIDLNPKIYRNPKPYSHAVTIADLYAGCSGEKLAVPQR